MHTQKSKSRRYLVIRDMKITNGLHTRLWMHRLPCVCIPTLFLAACFNIILQSSHPTQQFILQTKKKQQNHLNACTFRWLWHEHKCKNVGAWRKQLNTREALPEALFLNDDWAPLFLPLEDFPSPPNTWYLKRWWPGMSSITSPLQMIASSLGFSFLLLFPELRTIGFVPS